MQNKKFITLQNQLDKDFFDFVRRPGRYIGGEFNSTKKDLNACELTIAICFPDAYEVAMSNAGIQILYSILNAIDNIAAERVFSPWTDAEEILRNKNIPLFTLESKAPVKDFDIIGFSVTNELCYTNVLNILDLAGLELRSENRKEDDPLIIAGGGMSNCCEPLSPFVDVFVIGDGEESAVQICELIKKCKANNISKADTLKQIHESFDWAYVPCFYDVTYDGDKINSITPDKKLENAIVKDFENTPVHENPIVPFIDTVHERTTVEIMRGCPGRCRFCQASFTTRPIRSRSPERIFDIAKKSYLATGFDTVSLLSLSSADYPHLEELFEKLFKYFTEKKVGISLPSLRVDQQLQLLPKFVKSVRKGGLTIAVEAASPKTREMMNKPLTDEDLFAAVSAAYKAGWQKLKLYFMVGFQGETQQDIERIVDLSYELAMLRKEIAGRPAQINVAVSWLIPKPHTPFGWLGQKSNTYFQQAKELIINRKRQLRAKMLQIKFHDINRSVLESAICRGDRRLADVVETAWENGCRFDLWDEFFDYQKWVNAFEQHNLSIETLAEKSFDLDEILPWQHLGGPKTEMLKKHYAQAMEFVND